MRIVIDLQACQNGSRHRGIGRYVMAMTKALVRLDRGHQFHILLSDAFPGTILEVRRQLEGIVPQEDILVFSPPDRTSSTDPNNRWRTRAAEILRSQFIDGLAPDLLFVPSLFEGYWDRTVVSIEPTAYPVAVTLYDLIPLEYPYQHLPSETDRATYFQKVGNLRQADLLVAISDFVAREATDRLGIPSDRVISTPLGVDDWFYVPNPGSVDRAALMRRYGIDRPFVLNTSPLEYRKNIEGLIAGFASMRADIRDRHQLVIVGKMNVDAHRYVAGLVAAERLPPDAVVLAGYVPDEDLVLLYNQCELFAFPSLSEGFGLPVLEAMACGAPVVGSATTSIPEVIGRADLLFDPLDASAMGQAMERILLDPALQQELREFGPRRATNFSWERAAALAMAGFERLGAARSGGQEAAKPLPPPRARPRLAFVASTMAPQHRLTGHNISLITSLAEHHDVLVVCPESGTDDAWVRGVFELKDFAWFRINAATMDIILYSAGIDAEDDLVELMTDHPGALVLHETGDLQGSIVSSGRLMPVTLQKALLLSRGYAGLIDALADVPTPERAQSMLAKRLRHYASATVIATDAVDAGTGEARLTMPPLDRSSSAAAAFRGQHGIPEDVVLITGFAADEDTAARLIQAFRSSRTAQEENGHLALHVADASAAKRKGPGRMFGNIHIVDRLDPCYRGLVSASDLSILMGPLPRAMSERIERDAYRSAQTLVWSEHDRTPGTLQEAIDGCDRAASRSAVRRDGSVRVPTTLSRDAMAVLDGAIRAQTKGGARMRLASALPAAVRDTRPDGNDLAAMATAISRNEAHGREAESYCDVSAFASPGADRRLDPLSRLFLRTLLSRGGLGIHAVYAVGARFVVANQFIRNLIGLAPSPGFPDTVVDIRPGDRLLGFDMLASFQDPALPALRDVAERGGVIGYVAAGQLPRERSDQLDAIVDLPLAWAKARVASTRSHVAPADGIAVRPAGTEPAAAVATIEQLIAAGLPINVLALDHYPLRFAREIVGGSPPAILPTSLPVSSNAARDKLSAAIAQSIQPASGQTPYRPGYVVTGHLLGSYSLAIVNRNLARTLERAHPGAVRFLPVETVPIDHTEGVPADEKEEMIALSIRPTPSGGGEIVISHHYPVLLPDGDYRLALALFFWEESHVPPKTVRLLEKGFDGIISPTRSVTDALINSGLRIPIATIGQPVDISAYSALATARQPRKGIVTFLHVSSCFKRKGVDVLLAAWALAFSKEDDVRLVIKTFPNPHNDVERQVATLRESHPDVAPITIINRDADRDEMAAFYADADVMVLPSRGEGYNLPALEAMAAGLPLIVTGHGGHRDFCGHDEARLIAYRFAPTNSHVGGSHSMWVEPDVDDLARALLEQIDPGQAPRIEARRRRAMAAASVESDEDLWLRREAAMVSTLLKKSIGGTPRTAWVSSWGVQCGIAQYSDYLLTGMSAATRERMIILCDDRTLPSRHADIAYEPVWTAGGTPKADILAQAVERHGAEAVVIQHQDGLISWEQIGRIGSHPSLADTIKIAVLHNARNLHRVGGDELPIVLAGLSRMSRVLVHNISDVNFLLGLGLTRNVGLLPHGATIPPNAPWPRILESDDAPVIGCHGFFFRHKGIDKLIRAAAILRREWPGLRLRLVNARFPGGEHDAVIAECQQLAAELGMADAIEWHFDFLPVERIKQLLTGCDLLALPYSESDDSASGAVRVSLSSMVPFVATRVKIFAELGDSVAWADNNDPKTLADIIAPLLRSPAKRRAVQASMHEWLTDHDWKRISWTLEGIIESLVRQKRLGLDIER